MATTGAVAGRASGRLAAPPPLAAAEPDAEATPPTATAAELAAAAALLPLLPLLPLRGAPRGTDEVRPSPGPLPLGAPRLTAAAAVVAGAAAAVEAKGEPEGAGHTGGRPALLPGAVEDSAPAGID